MARQHNDQFECAWLAALAIILHLLRQRRRGTYKKKSNLSSLYPQNANPQAQIFREDTDATLSAAAKLVNNTRYIYFKRVAIGGKCIIQSCKDLHLGRIVCFKTLKPEFAKDSEEKRLFLREARVTAMLQHPNTAPVYEVGMDAKDNYYFTMKLVTGLTLAEILEGLRKQDKDITSNWDLERLIDVIIQVGQVLNYAHNYGVVHCDVKPENIVVGEYGEVLLLDWGLAAVDGKSAEPSIEEADAAADDNSLSSTASHPGTPLYMSPEQFAGQSLDHRTDIFSLGAILFEALTLQRLAWGETVDEIERNMADNPPPTPSLIAPERNIPAGLETIYFQCVQRDPNHRMQTVLQILHELLYWLKVDARHRPV